MDEVYRPKDYKTTEHFPLNDYFTEYLKILGSTTTTKSASSYEEDPDNLALIKDSIGLDIDLETIKKLNTSCRIDNLTCDIENTKDFPLEEIEKWKYHCGGKMPHVFVKNNTPNKKNVVSIKIKLEKIRSVPQLIYMNRRIFQKAVEFPVPEIPPDLQEGEDFITSILVYQPFAFKSLHGGKLRFSHEILALGRTKLTEIRNLIYCSSETMVLKEVPSTSVDLLPLKKEAQHYNASAYIFIDNIFYNDSQTLGAKDISGHIIEWAKTKNIELKSKNMDNVTVKSLQPRIGYPYLYMHQSNCEHIFVFSDIRLLQKTDSLYSTNYPHLYTFNKKSNKYCFLCANTTAKWICIDSDRLPQQIVYLCTSCCNSYNYINGEKVGNFKLYPYSVNIF